MNGKTAWRVALAVMLTAGPAAGQEAELVVSGGRVTDGRGGERSGVTVSPAVGWSDGRSTLNIRGAATVLDGGEPLWSGSLGGVVEVAGAGPFSAEIAGGGEAVAGTGWESAGGRVAPRLAVSGIGWTVLGGPVWGVTGERVESSSPGDGLLPVGGSTVEDSRSRGYGGVAAEARFFGETGALTGGWSGIRSEGAEWQEVAFGASAPVGGVVLGVQAGIRFGDVNGEWGGASAAIPLGSGTAVVMEAGRYAADPLLERPGGRYATVGVRIRGGMDGS